MDAKESTKLTLGLNDLEGKLTKLDSFISKAIERNKQETKDKYNASFKAVSCSFHDLRKLVRSLRK